MSGSSSTSYAAIWAEAEDAPCSGSVALADEGLALTGLALPGGEARLVRYADVVGVEVVRDASLRLNGYPTLRIERRGATPLRVSTIGLGVLGELNELLATAIASEQPRLVGIVVPLRKRALADAAALIEQGPPFDLEALGVERHDVLLSEREVIFLFEGEQLDETMQRLVRDPSVWQAASGWARVIAGRPAARRAALRLAQRPTDPLTAPPEVFRRGWFPRPIRAGRRRDCDRGGRAGAGGRRSCPRRRSPRPARAPTHTQARPHRRRPDRAGS